MVWTRAMARKAAKRSSTTEKTTTDVASTEVAESKQLPTSEKHSPLLALPAELRNRIWELVVVEDAAVEIRTNVKKAQSLQPALLRTCRQLRNESLPIYYSANTFLFRIDPSHDKPLLGHVEAYVNRMTRIQLHAICDHVGGCFELGVEQTAKIFTAKAASPSQVPRMWELYPYTTDANLKALSERLEAFATLPARDAGLTREELVKLICCMNICPWCETKKLSRFLRDEAMRNVEDDKELLE